MFRNLILIVMVVGAASMAGWFSINREGDQTTIQINRAEIREDAGRLFDRGREFLDEREQRLASQRQDNGESWNESGGYETYSEQDYRNAGYTDSRSDYQTDRYQSQQYRDDRYQDSSYHRKQYQTDRQTEVYDQRNYQPRVPYREAGYQRTGQVYRGQPQ